MAADPPKPPLFNPLVSSLVGSAMCLYSIYFPGEVLATLTVLLQFVLAACAIVALRPSEGEAARQG